MWFDIELVTVGLFIGATLGALAVCLVVAGREADNEQHLARVAHERSQ